MPSALPPSKIMNPNCPAQSKSLQVQPLRTVLGCGGLGASNGRSGGGWQGGRSKWPNKVDSPDGNAGVFPPEKKKYEKPPPSCHFCVAKKRPQSTHTMGACPWITAASKSDLLTTLPNLCLGCLKLKRGGEHKCLDNFREGGTVKHFCSTCKVNKKNSAAPPQVTLQGLYQRLLLAMGGWTQKQNQKIKQQYGLINVQTEAAWGQQVY